MSALLILRDDFFTVPTRWRNSIREVVNFMLVVCTYSQHAEAIRQFRQVQVTQLEDVVCLMLLVRADV